MFDNMSSSEQTQASPQSSIPADVKAEALDIVQDALEWWLAEARWPTIEQIVVAMKTAWQADDREGLEAAMADLELVGPRRIIPIGATSVVSAPQPIHDLLNQLVFELGGTTLAAQRQVAEGGETGNDASGPR